MMKYRIYDIDNDLREEFEAETDNEAEEEMVYWGDKGARLFRVESNNKETEIISKYQK